MGGAFSALLSLSAGGQSRPLEHAPVATIVIAVLAVILALATAISHLRVAHGFVRIFSFPRLQIVVVAAVLLAILIALPETGTLDSLTAIALVSVIIAQGFSIAQFTPLRRKQTALFTGDPNDPSTVSILSYNVKESNTDHDSAAGLATTYDADIALYMETNGRWVGALKTALSPHYPHIVEAPLENAYGMILFSRLELRDAEMQYLVMDEVPSIVATVVLRDGQRFRLHCVHPEPPVPHVDSLGRDAELLRVAEIVEKEALPSVVAGDLNDVAWSNTSRMFQRLSRLLDPRVGRGFYNTFDTRFPFMRWPLDHLFHDARFSLVSMKRLPNAGSDHFPMWFKLALAKRSVAIEMPDEPDAEDLQEAAEIKREGDRLDRDPIGTDWEKS